ncbi:MAG: SPOR domain-containing protein [Myxococcota bacterium]
MSAEPPASAPPSLPDTASQVLARLRARQVAPHRPGPVVQVAAYNTRDAAEALARRLSQRGYDCYVSRTRGQGRERFRVRVRAGSANGAQELAARLRSEGLSTWVTRE